ncbi:unnamed protein product [Enterobius vermicularis]|uniref:Uncharacterized protein n=1 Tax=Enterobius vermicularis TaxID=51028 RepID=A0A0N4VIF2_ENTVE|nr:unnamed protein product [Enterobius vermicularis]
MKNKDEEDYAKMKMMTKKEKKKEKKKKKKKKKKEKSRRKKRGSARPVSENWWNIVLEKMKPKQFVVVCCRC